MNKKDLKKAWQETYQPLYVASLLLIGAGLFKGMSYLFPKKDIHGINVLLIIVAIIALWKILQFIISFVSIFINNDD